jgi:hypothetical protein
MPKINKQFIASHLFILLVGTISAFAQEQYGTLKGSISDDLGSVSNATITLISNSTSVGNRYQRQQISNTSGDGAFAFTSVPFGTYNIKIENKCVTARRNGIEINSTKAIIIDIKIDSVDCVQKESLEAAKWKTCDENTSKSTFELTDSDRGEIFLELIKNSEEEYQIPDYDILVNQAVGIVMSAENSDKDWLKLIPNLKITIVNLTEIKAFAKKRKEDILVLSFSSKAIGNCVKANIGTGWVVGKKSNLIYLSGGGCSYTFRKESGKWIGKQESCSIS